MGKRILVVEDDPKSLQPYFAALEQHGHEVLVHASVAKASVLLRRCAWEVALIDARHESRAWHDFARQLRRACPDMKIIYVAANGDAVSLLDRDLPLTQNTMVLSRPVDIRVLLKLI
jgi:DNA-binding response OmpR family regulator